MNRVSKLQDNTTTGARAVLWFERCIVMYHIRRCTPVKYVTPRWILPSKILLQRML